MNCAEFIALDLKVLQAAVSFEELYNLNSQDAIILASVISSLQTTKPNKAYFPNKNTKDFDSPDVVQALLELNCRMIPRFDHALSFLKSQL